MMTRGGSGTSMVPNSRAMLLQRGNQSTGRKQLDGKVIGEYWEMYDTRIFSANTLQGDTAAFNFAQLTTPLPFFASRTIGTHGEAVTSMNQAQILDMPFKAYGVGIHVHCDIDATSASGIATAQAFVETVVNYTALQIKIGGDTKLLLPTHDAPSGGGVYYGVRTDSRVAGANQLNGSANNGFPSQQGRVYWPTPFLFDVAGKNGFNINLITAGSTSAGALHRIQGLSALTGDLQACIRVTFWGYRGKSLAPGVPANT